MARLLVAQAGSIDAVDLERARNQVAVRTLRTLEDPERRLEEAALDLFARGRLRSDADRLARVEGVTADSVRTRFERMLAAGASVAIAGSVGRAASERARTALAALHVSAG